MARCDFLNRVSLPRLLPITISLKRSRWCGSGGSGRRSLTADFADFVHLHGLSGVAKAIANVSEDVGDLIIREVIERNHGAIVFFAVNGHLARLAEEHTANGALFVGHQEIRFCER